MVSMLTTPLPRLLLLEVELSDTLQAAVHRIRFVLNLSCLHDQYLSRQVWYLDTLFKVQAALALPGDLLADAVRELALLQEPIANKEPEVEVAPILATCLLLVGAC